MRKIASLALVSCVLAVLVASTASSLAQAAPEAARVSAASEPTVFSVLTMARDLIEGMKLESSRDLNEMRNEAIRIPLRHRLALTMRRTGYESAFGDYVDNAIIAWEAWDPTRSSHDR